MKTDVENEGQRAIKLGMGNMITGADLSGGNGEAAIVAQPLPGNEFAQEDAMRRYALIERVLRCPPSMLTALENTLGMDK